MCAFPPNENIFLDREFVFITLHPTLVAHSSRVSSALQKAEQTNQFYRERHRETHNITHLKTLAVRGRSQDRCTMHDYLSVIVIPGYSHSNGCEEAQCDDLP